MFVSKVCKNLLARKWNWIFNFNYCWEQGFTKLFLMFNFFSLLLFLNGSIDNRKFGSIRESSIFNSVATHPNATKCEKIDGNTRMFSKFIFVCHILLGVFIGKIQYCRGRWFYRKVFLSMSTFFFSSVRWFVSVKARSYRILSN